MAKLPSWLKDYFWDVKFEELDKDEHWYLITKRVLDRGNTQAVKWVVQEYGLNKIKEVLLSSRDLAAATGVFWAGILGLSPSQVQCLNKPYSRTPFGLSS